MAKQETRGSPHGGAYDNFPDGPEGYRAAAADATLKSLFRAAVGHGQDRIDWYDDKARERSGVAKRIRFLSLLLFAIGTITPVMLSMIVKLAQLFGSKPPDQATFIDVLAKIPLAEIGYVFLAFAGALVIFDQFFDASGSWIRFRQSQARLEVMLAELRFAWATSMAKYGGVISDQSRAAELTTVLRDFVTKIELLAEAETKQWAEHFRSSISAFDQNPDLKVKLGGQKAMDRGTTDSAGGAPSPSADQTRSDDLKGGQTATSAVDGLATLPKATMRLAIANAEQLESLALTVDDAPVALPADGHVELPLEVGSVHRLVATGRRAGQGVRGSLDVKPTLEDERRPLALALS